jgi:hypothetical protein
VLLAGVTALCGFGIQAQAAITTFVDDKAAFLAATGASSATEPLPNIGSGCGRTVEDVTFICLSGSLRDRVFIGAAGVVGVGDWYDGTTGNDVAINDFENMDVAFAGAVYSMGFDFVEPDATMPSWGGSPVDSTFEVTLKDGPTTVGTFQFNAPDDVITFVGVWSDTAFNRVEIREISGGIDDEYFGEFYTGTTPWAAPPPVLYGTDITFNFSLFTIDLTTGAATTVGALVPPTQVEGLAFNPDSKRFFGVDNSNHTLIEISTNPVNWAVVQLLPLETYTNLARSPITGIYYTHLNNTDTLATVDPLTGAVVPVGSSSGMHVESLAFDSSGRLFAIGPIPAPSDGALYEIDVSTGAILSSVEITSNLVNPRFHNSLAIHPITGAFYTVAAIEGGLYEVNPSTGVATRIGDTGLTDIRSLDFARISTPVPVSLDIKPGGDPNAVNPNSRGVIPVAILTTDTFDATTVDPTTAEFGPAGATIGDTSGSMEDVDGDGDLDLLLRFRTQETGIACGDTEASLSGETSDGTSIEGSDSIVTVGCI